MSISIAPMSIKIAPEVSFKNLQVIAFLILKISLLKLPLADSWFESNNQMH